MSRKRTNYIVVHCSASPPKNTHVNAKEIDRWHRQRGWLMIGYHYVITRDAVLEKGRNQEDAGAHVEGHNHESIGVCLVGGVSDKTGKPEDNFTTEQKQVLHAILLRLRGEYPQAKIVGHWELDPKKACPVLDIKTFLLERPELAPIQEEKRTA